MLIATWTSRSEFNLIVSSCGLCHLHDRRGGFGWTLSVGNSKVCNISWVNNVDLTRLKPASPCVRLFLEVQIEYILLVITVLFLLVNDGSQRSRPRQKYTNLRNYTKFPQDFSKSLHHHQKIKELPHFKLFPLILRYYSSIFRANWLHSWFFYRSSKRIFSSTIRNMNSQDWTNVWSKE